MKRNIKIITLGKIEEKNVEIYEYGGFVFGLSYENLGYCAYELQTGKVAASCFSGRRKREDCLSSLRKRVDSGMLTDAINQIKKGLEKKREELLEELKLTEFPLNK